MTRRTWTLLATLLLLPTFASAAERHRVSSTPAIVQPDALGVGPISGAAISGTVGSVDGTTIALQTGGAAAIRIDAADARFVSAGGLASLADVVPGVRITAFFRDAAPAISSPLTAALIAIESFPDLAVAGPVQSIDAANDRFTVLGVRLSADAGTTFGTTFPTFAPIRGVSDLAVGQIVSVAASFAGSVIHADRVTLLAPLAPIPTTIGGTVKSIGATSWVITGRDGGDIAVIVDANTKIIGNPQVGDTVQVLATIDSAHQTVAIAIVNVGAIRPPSTVELHGFVKSIAADQWVIGGPPGSMAPDFLVRITPLTILYPHPAVGDRVVVKALQTADGVPVAIAITRQP